MYFFGDDEDLAKSEVIRIEQSLEPRRKAQISAAALTLIGAACAVVSGNGIWFAGFSALGLLVIFSVHILKGRWDMKVLTDLRKAERALIEKRRQRFSL